MIPSPTQSQIMTAIGNFLTAVLPAGVFVVQGQNNRVPEPVQGDFVVFTPIRRDRLETNLDITADAKFTGQIAGTTLTITHVYPGFPGEIGIGSPIAGTGIALGTAVTALGTGSGGLGTYFVSNPQTISSRTISAGSQSMTQGTQLTVQFDFHSANVADSADMVQVVSTTLRDQFGVSFFAALDPPFNAVAPLHADDPRQAPFINDSGQYETRWTLDAIFQANQTVVVPQEFADAVDVTVVSVDATFPP